MVSLGIPEFTFGYAFLYEQTQNHWGNLRAVPILPTLRQERDLGWDARLPLRGTDYYYQFKMSDYLTRGNSKYLRDGTYQNAYYRFSLHKKENNRQHQRLKELSLTNRDTYYVATEFNNHDAFNTSFLAGTLSDETRLIPVAECEDHNDSEQHYITFQQGQTGWIEHSKSKFHEESYSGKEIDRLYQKNYQKHRNVDKHYIDDIYRKTSSIVKIIVDKEEERIIQTDIYRETIINNFIDTDPGEYEQNDVLINTSKILSIVFGATMVLVGDFEEERE